MSAHVAVAIDVTKTTSQPLGPDSIAGYWSDWQRGDYPSTRSASARWYLSQLKLQLSAAAQASADGDRLLSGFDSVVRQAAVGAHLFASLASHPSAMQMLLQLVTVAPRLTAAIAGRPDAFDALIAHRPSADAMSTEELARALSALRSE